jgi:DNA polymerase-3 subunit gamma/tau
LIGRSIDLIEIDAASNRGIDDIRALREKAAFASSGKRKVYLIDEAHMLTEAAFNALLKLLEEPPSHVVFILATTEQHKIPATISSRCQRFQFRRAPTKALVSNLEMICQSEGIKCVDGVLDMIARSATGSHRDAVGLLDQLVTTYGNKLTLTHVRDGLGLIEDERVPLLVKHAIRGKLAEGLELLSSIRDDGLDLRQFQRELVTELRRLLGIRPSHAGIAFALRCFSLADLKQDPFSTIPLDIALVEITTDWRKQNG